MKYIILLAACFFGTQTFAQELKLDMNKVKKYLDQSKASQGFSPTKPQKQLSTILIKKSMFDTVRFSHKTAQGDVFILPQDNMPCLKPTKNGYASTMPNAIVQNTTNSKWTPAQIPNAFKGKDFVLVFPKKINPDILGK
jgi:hypothetical protein